ncbi:MAG TPA: DoxX family membrane protein [Arachnia sp.]|nr:DoxX family membrane protein [Arachnia sp.]
MSNNDWVQESTPRDEEWTAEQDEYGVPVEPAEWDDYASEQTVPVPPAPVQPAAEVEQDEPPVTGTDADDDSVAVEPAQEEPPAVEADQQPEEEWQAEEPVSGDVPAGDGADQRLEDEWAADEVDADSPDQPVADDEVADQEPVVNEEPVVDHEAAAEEPVVEDELVVEDEAAVEEPVVEDEPVVEEEPVAVGSFGRPVDREPLSEDDSESTRAMPVLAAAGAAGTASAAPGAAPAVAGAATLAGLYRADRDRADETRVIDGSQRQSYDDELAEEERQAHQLRADKEARNQRLGLVQTSEANAVRDPSPLRRRGVGHFGSFGLFVLRLVTAAILGVVGYQVLSDIDATAEFLGATLIPEPRLVAWIIGFGLAVLAVLLVIGLAVRVAGLLLAVVAVGSLAFIRWGQFSPFVAGMEGFLGDHDLLLAAVGILFLSLGGGRWGIDGAFVKARETAREAKH